MYLVIVVEPGNMQFQSLLLPVMLSLQTLLTLEITATGFYFASHGYFNNSCRVAECRTCSTGEYRMGCSNASGGICTSCTRIPNATFTTHGWFNDSCGFMCNAGYSVTNGSRRSCSKVSMQYTINFVARVRILNNISQSFNLTSYINTVAILAGCGQCMNASLNPVSCRGCKLYYNFSISIPVVYRRLLSSGSVVDIDTNIVINDDRNLANVATSSINSSMLNSRLSGAGFGAVTVVKAPTLTELTIISQVPSMPIIAPSTSPKALPQEGSNFGVVIGGAVGGVAAVVCMILLVSFYTRKGTHKINALPRTNTSNSMFAYKQAGSNKLSSQLVFMRKHQNQ